MLPLELAAGPLSLRAGQRCAALSVAVRLDEDGSVAEQRIARSWIRPRYGLTYTDGDELIELAPPCLLYTSPSPRDRQKSRMPSSA